MGYNIKDKASQSASELEKVEIKLEEKKDVVTIDNKPLDFSEVEKKIKNLIIEVNSELNNTNNIN